MSRIPKRSYNHRDAVAIVAWAKRHPLITETWAPEPTGAEILRAAADLEKIWGGHFSAATILLKLRSAVRTELIAQSPIALVPCDAADMTEGQTYLMIERGLSAMVVRVQQGKPPATVTIPMDDAAQPDFFGETQEQKTRRVRLPQPSEVFRLVELQQRTA